MNVDIEIAGNVLLMSGSGKPFIEVANGKVKFHDCFITHLAPKEFWPRVKVSWLVLKTFWRSGTVWSKGNELAR